MIPVNRSERPSSRVRLWLRWSLPAVGVALFLLPLVSSSIVYPKWDEFIVSFDAQRILNGQIPYRDFFNFIPPGIFYFLAGAGWIFGRVTLTVSRFAALLVILTNWLLLRTALEKAGWRWWHALALSLVYPVCLYPFWPVASHHWLVHLTCMAFLLVVAKTDASDMKSAAFMGLCAGTAAVILQTDGLYLGVAGLALILLTSSEKKVFKNLTMWGGGLVLPLILGFVPLLLMGAGPSMVRDILLWPAHNYSRTGNDNARGVLADLPIRLDAIWSGVHTTGDMWRTLPLAIAGTVLYALLLASTLGLFVAAIWVLLRALRRRTLDYPVTAVASLVTVLAIGMFFRGRPGWLWLIYLFAFLMAFWLVAAAKTHLSEVARRRIVILALILLAAGGIYQSRWIWYHWPNAQELTDVDRPIRDSAVNRWLRTPGVLRKGDTVAAFPEGGEVYLYGAPPAVGYTFFMPLSERYNSLRDHEIVANQLVRNKPRWVLVTPGMEKAFLDPASPVGRLLRKDYRRLGQVGDAVVYKRTAGP